MSVEFCPACACVRETYTEDDKTCCKVCQRIFSRQQLPSFNSSPIMAEVEVGWVPDKVFITGLLYGTACWTPDQAEQLASLLLSCARKARGQQETT